MVIMYDSVLTEPPSSVYCFRDVTLYVKVFLEKDNLLICPKGTRTMYWEWIKKYGAHDFIEEILTDEESEYGIHVGENKNININVLNEINYGNVIGEIKARLMI